MKREQLESKVKARLMNRLISDLNQVAMDRAIEAESKANAMMQGMAQYQAYASSELERLHEVDSRLADTESKLKALQSEDEELSETFDAYAERMSMKIVELKREIRGLKVNGGDAEIGNRLADAEAMLKEYQQQMTKLQYKQQILEDRLALNRSDLSDVGMYMDVLQLFYEEGDTERYMMELERNIADQEMMVSNGTACVCKVKWCIANSEREGERMTKNNIKIALRCFNVECDNWISKISTRSKLDTIIKHIEGSFNAMNRMMKQNKVEIKEAYLELKRQQAKIVFEQMLARKAKREEEARQREILREQERIEKEIQQQKEKALKEQQQYLKEQQRLMKQAQQTQAMKDRIAELEAYIKQLNNDMEELDQYTTFRCRSGYVYVISQPNSNQVKIGVTRRLDPMVRVQELSNASVAFKMNVHAIMFAEDAFALESQLHNHFAQQRVNKVNSHKEWFYLTSEEVEAYVHSDIDSTVEFNHNPYNEEYEQTLEIERN